MDEYGEALIWEMQDLIEMNYIQTYQDWEEFSKVMGDTALNFFQDKMAENRFDVTLRIV